MPKGQIKPKQRLIDQKQFEQLCWIQCTQQEIASVFGVSIDTLERWCNNTYNKKFADVYSEKRQGRQS